MQAINPAEAWGLSEYVLLAFSAAMIMFMQAGFAFVEAGAARVKNTVNILMKNFCDMCIGGLGFWAIGYGFMYGYNPSGWIGMSNFLPNGASNQEMGMILFQMLFASAAATIVSGAIAERTRFKAYIWGSVIISAIIYPIIGSWVWGSYHGGEGWLKALGFVDFAGSAVVHLVGGSAALAALLVVKPRLGKYGADGTARNIQGHNMTLTVLGAFILWMGWFGFNGGSILSDPDGITTNLGRILLNTHLAGLAGGAGAMLLLRVTGERTMLTVTVNGALCGLVAVTAGSATVNAGGAIITGFVAGVLATIATPLMDRFKLDDVVGAVPVHLVGGIWGTLAVALFTATPNHKILPALGIQALGALAIFTTAFVATYAVYYALNRITGVRVASITQQRGLDIVEHDEVAYPEFMQDVTHQGAKNQA